MLQDRNEGNKRYHPAPEQRVHRYAHMLKERHRDRRTDLHAGSVIASSQRGARSGAHLHSTFQDRRDRPQAGVAFTGRHKSRAAPTSPVCQRPSSSTGPLIIRRGAGSRRRRASADRDQRMGLPLNLKPPPRDALPGSKSTSGEEATENMRTRMALMALVTPCRVSWVGRGTDFDPWR